jgi:hypothetical protein
LRRYRRESKALGGHSLDLGVPAKKPLEPKDFPIETDDTKITKSDGEPIADAENKATAEILAIDSTAIMLAKEENRWACVYRKLKHEGW